MQCKYCGGPTEPNARKVPGAHPNWEKFPDWICLQQNGKCVNEKGYPQGTYNPKGQATPKTPVQKFEKDLDNDLAKKEYKLEQAELGAQKNRSNLAAAWIRSNRPVDEKTFKNLALFEGYVLNGVIKVQPTVIAPVPPVDLKDKIANNPKFQEPPMNEQDALWDSIVKSSQ